jgi:hypothetical protein
LLGLVAQIAVGSLELIVAAGLARVADSKAVTATIHEELR